MGNASITLSQASVDRLRALTKAGDFASPDEALRAALDALESGAPDELERWLRETVSGRIDAVGTGEDAVMDAAAVRARLLAGQ